MIGIIVAGHGNFASGMTSTVNLIAGDQEHYLAVDFIQGMTGDELTNQIKQAISKLSTKEIVIFTDILGGAPFRSASLLAQENPHNIEVVSGVNAQMLIESCLEREEYENAASLTHDMITSGKEGISTLKLELAEKAAKKAAQQQDEEGGI